MSCGGDASGVLPREARIGERRALHGSVVQVHVGDPGGGPEGGGIDGKNYGSGW